MSVEGSVLIIELDVSRMLLELLVGWMKSRRVR